MLPVECFGVRSVVEEGSERRKALHREAQSVIFDSAMTDERFSEEAIRRRLQANYMRLLSNR
jgi:hypothetical protein